MTVSGASAGTVPPAGGVGLNAGGAYALGGVKTCPQGGRSPF